MHGNMQLQNLYTIFGEVTEGLDIVDKIGNVETIPGDRPMSEIVIESIEVLPVK